MTAVTETALRLAVTRLIRRPEKSYRHSCLYLKFLDARACATDS